jgi:hypothetical protein
VGLHSQSKGANRTPPDRPFASLLEAPDGLIRSPPPAYCEFRRFTARAD